MNILSSIEIPDIFPYLSAILGLLLLWQYHQSQVLAGRILAIDIFDRSGIRMYLYAIPDDDTICAACREPNGMVFLPSMVARKDFTPRSRPCAKSDKCTSVLVGLYGAWLEARGLLERLRAAKSKGPLHLSPEDMRGVINGQWERSVSAETDRLAVHMLEGLCYEQINPDVSISSYRYVIDQVKEVRHLPFRVPAYLRLMELLARLHRPQEALALVEDFETRYPRDRRGPHSPTETQRGMLAIMKSRLRATPISLKPESVVKSATIGGDALRLLSDRG